MYLPVELSMATSTRDLFLSPDERYQVWTVKVAERPELLQSTSSDDPPTSAGEATADHQNVLPLTDGCDIPAWRKEQLIPLAPHSEVKVVLETAGPGCTLLRRESQIPFVALLSIDYWPPQDSLRYDNDGDYSAEPVVTSKACHWEQIRQELFQPPPEEPGRILYSQLLCNGDGMCSLLHPNFERENRPVIIDGCMDDWTAMESCRFDRLVERFGHLEWRFSDTHAETMSLKSYSKYIATLEGLSDDAPLAVYDSQFDQDERIAIVSEYTVPKCFDTDLFMCCSSEEHRPPYRWILIGPGRSGTGLHIDPVGTHAWVSLIQGAKRWVLFPPNTCRQTIHMQDPQIPSVIWFRDFYQHAMQSVPGAVEVLQKAGETVYVPAGWPHLVLNLELSVAITHNYATEFPSLQQLFTAVQEAEPELAVNFWCGLHAHRPDLASRLTVGYSD